LAADSTFEKSKNVMGRPTYRDRSVPSGYGPATVPDEEKPAWMRDHTPTNGEFASTGKLTKDGIVENGSHG
jgi:hypothetical protein